MKQIFVTNTRIENTNNIELKAGMNSLINLDIIYDKQEDYSQQYQIKSTENYFQTFSSPINNIGFISSKNKLKNEKFIFNHFWNKYLYVDKSDSDITINRSFYEPRYSLFSILNENTFDYFIQYIQTKNIFMNQRLNTGNFKINDLINIYVDNLNITYNLYVKKYYGPIQIYESQYILDDYSNITLLAKPINNLKEKKSIFNRLIQLNKHQLITGYLSPNSFIDIYFEKDNDNKDIYLKGFKNRKYLKKGIEYQIHFDLHHLIKLEPQFKAEIIIYNKDTKIILNDKNETGILIGRNFKMKANNNAMVYFYPKTQKFQKKLVPKAGEIIEIKIKTTYSLSYSIDFGFEGFEPPNMGIFYLKNQLYIDNIYDKLDIKLAKEEYLFFYYWGEVEYIEVNYLNNYIMSSSYRNNFYLIKQNNLEDKNFIIPYLNEKKIRLKINHCKSNLPYKIEIYYGNYNKSNINKPYYGEIVQGYYGETEDNVDYKFSFKTKTDFILTYSYEDEKDMLRELNKNWKKNRTKLNNLTINKIAIINESTINIKFNSNYNNSLTKYIIMITPEEKNNTFENLKDFCFVTELINKKDGDFFTEEIYDIGENNEINTEIKLPNFKCMNKRCIVNIISEELRFDRFIRFYEPKIFIIEKSNLTNIIIQIALIFILIFIYMYFIRSSKYKVNKNNELKMNEKSFRIELVDSSDAIKNKNN